MNLPDKLVVDVIEAAGGEIVGRIRLQKIFYLLEQKGFKSDAQFHYYHYGPYSRILDGAIEKAKALRGLREEIRHRRDGATYSVFEFSGAVDQTNQVGGLPRQSVSELVESMKSKTSTILELAATIHWLAYVERVADWRSELVLRKGVKTQNGRAEEALQFLAELGLSPT
jgi:uncharacterized protein YwgA